MKLYTMPGACSLASHIVLEWIGKPYQAQKLNHDEIKTPEFLKLNPAGAVPVLEDEGWVLTQNVAILNYLADRFPDTGLHGDGTPRARAEINRWLGFLNADMHPSFKPLFGATGYLEDEETIERTKANAKATLRILFERNDTQLARHAWLAETRSGADAYLFVMTRWARAMGIDLAGLDHLNAWFERMREDAGVRKALEAEGLS
ncbi:glutathione S-transferase N-terminal domain-containing protein [Oleiagrimonas sp.]|jgi:glutathione S-transferase|uniref:glutathione S-transferase family protein n=1 Tax=Oleiagrimonas sp. TaxID=2010330 RepID=UPI002619BE56|nr:glutathione S-transferase N-terminal domain-containing protein [Oleiagrimonas sp.]MDA3913746.1 glutathione S-transferase N-terminal domain-containing protein [Oleiagrimonas sp.]